MDFIVEYIISKDLQGHTIFYRWSNRSYYILPNNKKKEAELRSFLKNFYLGFIGAMIITASLGIQYSLIVIPIFILWYYFETEHFVKGLKKGHW